MIIDTHIHLDDARYANDLEAVLERARIGGVRRFIIPGADPANLERAVSIAESNKDVYFAIGVHPYDIDSYDEAYLRSFAGHPKCIAVGECGLDYFRLPEEALEKAAIKAKQAEVFRAQIALAKELGKPVIVHIRDASSDAKAILLEERASAVGGVLHCFNADEQLLSLAQEGFYFGIGGVLTFKNAKKLVNVLAKIPREKLLLETDGPYLTPHPYRGERNEPGYTALVAKKISELLELPYEGVAALTSENARRCFNAGKDF